MVENIFIENIINFLQFLMLSAEIKVLILEPAITISFKVARVCNLSPVNLLSFRKCLLLSLDSWAQVGLSSYCSPLLSMSWDNRNKLVQLTWRHQVLQVCSVGFIQNHL